MAVTGTRATLWGWGGQRRVPSIVHAPETVPEAARALDPAGTIARGLGRSYGDAAVNADRVVVQTTRLDRLLSFDPTTGVVVCEAGVSLAQLIERFAPLGFFPAITPGTKLVTVGGCIANDVHGKAHHAQGAFASCVQAMRVLLADGRVVTASRTDNADLFWATFGGMGLLGLTALCSGLPLRRWTKPTTASTGPEPSEPKAKVTA